MNFSIQQGKDGVFEIPTEPHCQRGSLGKTRMSREERASNTDTWDRSTQKKPMSKSGARVTKPGHRRGAVSQSPANVTLRSPLQQELEMRRGKETL